jgi:hypothetical protein
MAERLETATKLYGTGLLVTGQKEGISARALGRRA